MTPEDRKKLAERLRRASRLMSYPLGDSVEADLRAAADILDPPQPAGTERVTVLLFRDANGLFAEGNGNDTDTTREVRVRRNSKFGVTLAATIVADIPLPPEPPVVEGTVQP